MTALVRRLTVVVLGLAALVLVVACQPEPLPVVMPVPTFTLVDQTGALISDDMLIDRVGIVGFGYTNCDDNACDLLTARMVQVYRELEASGDLEKVQFMTFTVDPRRDTPEVLAQYAQERNAPWTFITGTEGAVRQTVTGGWKVPFFDRTDGSGGVSHLAPLFITDGDRRVRAVYQGLEMSPTQVTADIRRLLRE